MCYQGRGAIKILSRSFVNLLYDSNISLTNNDPTMIIGREITQQMGLAAENEASGSPGQEKSPKIIKPKYILVFSDVRASSQQKEHQPWRLWSDGHRFISLQLLNILSDPVWTFLVF